MQINVRPKDICLLTDSGLLLLSFLLPPVMLRKRAQGFNLPVQIHAHPSGQCHGGRLDAFVM